jgi:ferredoxin
MAANPKTERRRVRCVINGREIDVWQGYRLWDAALDADARLWKWCGGQGFCATCAVIPVSGEENLSPPTHLEKFSLALWFLKPLALVRKRWRSRPIRLACQSYVSGPVEVVGVLGKAANQAREASGLE